jgi:hypothetical protein
MDTPAFSDAHAPAGPRLSGKVTFSVAVLAVFTVLIAFLFRVVRSLDPLGYL